MVSNSTGCQLNIAFGNALSRIFLDLDDTRSLRRAFNVLNNELIRNKDSKKNKSRRLISSDERDLAYLRWTKSAINLHNNNHGRQVGSILLSL